MGHTKLLCGGIYDYVSVIILKLLNNRRREKYEDLVELKELGRAEIFELLRDKLGWIELNRRF